MYVIQLDLFEERTVRLQRSRRALLESFDLVRTRQELHGFVGCDAEADKLHAIVTRIDAILTAEMERAGDAVDALLRTGSAVPDWLKPGWHRRVAYEAERRYGFGCRVADETAGFHLLRAGDLEQAERSLRATLEHEVRDARSRARLGDVLYRRGETSAARVEYLRALLEAPETVDWVSMADPEVSALPVIAVTEYGIGGEPAGWAAAVGTVEGLLPWPAPTLAGIQSDEPPPENGHPGLRFHRLLCAERAARTLADRALIRRDMKALGLSLLRAYLERWR